MRVLKLFTPNFVPAVRENPVARPISNAPKHMLTVGWLSANQQFFNPCALALHNVET